jgi:hypothetical protein
VLLLVASGGVLYLLARPALGGVVEGARLARAERSPQWRGDRFRNRRPSRDTWRPGAGPEGSAHQSPDAPVAVVRRTAADYRTPPASGLRVTWLGHSTTLVEIDGQRVLTDPMWSARASPLPFVGPRRFFAPPLPLAELPAVDAVVISHDHYDHLDMATVKALSARGVRFLVPLAVGARLAAWGLPDSLVTELDWWDSRASGRSRSPRRRRATTPPAVSVTVIARSGRAGRSPARATACSTAATRRCTTSSSRSASGSARSTSH